MAITFSWDERQPTIHEGWMSKANVRVFGEVWQKRYFRLQGRCIFYFKKENEGPPCGFIPLINIAVKDIKPSKKVKFGFQINITNMMEPKIAKRDEYLIQTENDETRQTWKKIILANRARSVVGEPLLTACEVSPTSSDVHSLLPYFMPKLFEKLDSTGYKLRGIWTVDIPADILERYMAILNQNFVLPLDDVHNAVGALLCYMKRLPSSLLPSEAMPNFRDKVTPDQIRQLVLECPAPVRQCLKVLGYHFKRVLDATAQNGVTQYSLLFLGPLLIRAPKGGSIPPMQAKSIQDQVAQVFVANAAKILEDVHQFLEAPRQPVTQRARLVNTQANMGEDVLEATRGLLVNIVRTDAMGWCTVYTSNRRVGLVHKTNMKPLSQEEENELKSGPNVDAMMDVVREKMPEMMLLFDSMMDESMKIREALEG